MQIIFKVITGISSLGEKYDQIVSTHAVILQCSDIMCLLRQMVVAFLC